MNKNIIKKYASCINEETIRNYADKEGINLTFEEVNTILYVIKNDIDEVLDSKSLCVLDKYKDKLSNETLKIIYLLFEKYKNFIN